MMRPVKVSDLRRAIKSLDDNALVLVDFDDKDIVFTKHPTIVITVMDDGHGNVRVERDE